MMGEDANKYRTIIFEDGSNPYICKNVKEFNRIKRKYKLTSTGTPDFYVAKAERKK